MKKILFLLLICFIKLNAYEYLFLSYPASGAETGVRFGYFINNNGNYRMFETRNGVKTYYKDYQYETFSNFKRDYYPKYVISATKFKEYYKNDVIFLNDLYTSSNHNRNVFLNYLYNDSNFTNSNYINYENYQILYNTEGLAVESIVGGVWKGLYDTPENSGLLYDQANNILYDNGQLASLFNRFWFSLTGNVSKTLKLYYISMLSLNVFILILAVYLVKVLLGLIIKWITTVINNTKVNVNLGAQKRW